MEKIKNKGKLIQQYLGEVLSQQGFVYKGYEGDSWIFVRQQGEVEQFVQLYQYRFDPSLIRFELYTDVRGTGVIEASAIEGVCPNGAMGFWKYDTEEEFIQVLLKMVEAILSKGMKILEELSVADDEEDIVTSEMNHTLYLHHEEMAKEFEKTYDIEVTGFDQENIDRWFTKLGDITRELKKGSFKDAKETLVAMAAFLGEKVIQYRGGEWCNYFCKDYEGCAIKRIKAKNSTRCNVLDLVAIGYTENGLDWVKEVIEEFIEPR